MYKRQVHIPTITLIPEGGERITAYVLLDESADVLKWLPQAIPGDDVDAAMTAYQAGGFTAGEDAAYELDLWGSGRGGAGDSGDILLSNTSENSEIVNFTWMQLTFDFSTQTIVEIPNNDSARYIGTHDFIPGVPTADMGSSLILSLIHI